MFKNPEHKGIFGLVAAALILGTIYLGLTGKLTDWFGIRFTLKEPMTNRIVFVSDRNGYPDIWSMKPDGSDPKPITNDKYLDSEPVVSPDGYQIAFISKRDTIYSQIYVMDTDGAHLHRITNNITGSKSSLRFSPDSREVLFLCAGSVWKARVNDDSPDRLLPTHSQTMGATMGETKAPYKWADLSPDGTTVAAIQEMEEGQIPVWMVSEDEGPRPVIDQALQDRPLGGETVFASWAPSGKDLAVVMNAPNGKGVLVTADITSESVSQVLLGGSMGEVAWSPDGQTLAVQATKRVARDDYKPIGFVVVDKSGSSPKAFHIKDATDLKWSPDGKTMLFIQGKDIFSVDPAGGEPINLTKGKGSNSGQSFAPRLNK